MPLPQAESGAVPWPDLEPLGPLIEGLQALPQRPRAALHGPLDVGGALQQVRPSHVTDEDEVAGGGGDGLVGRQPIGDEEGDVFRRVAGRGDHVHGDPPHLDAVAVADHAGLGGELILPVLIAFVGEVQRRPGAGRELARAGEEVRVDVRLGHVPDREPLSRGLVQVALDVAVRVDDDGLAGLGATDQIAGLRDRRLVDAGDDHDSPCMTI